MHLLAHFHFVFDRSSALIRLQDTRLLDELLQLQFLKLLSHFLIFDDDGCSNLHLLPIVRLLDVIQDLHLPECLSQCVHFGRVVHLGFDLLHIGA